MIAPALCRLHRSHAGRCCLTSRSLRITWRAIRPVADIRYPTRAGRPEIYAGLVGVFVPVPRVMRPGNEGLTSSAFGTRFHQTA